MAKNTKISCKVKIPFVDMELGVAYVKGQMLQLSQEDYNKLSPMLEVEEEQVATSQEEATTLSEETPKKKPAKRKPAKKVE